LDEANLLVAPSRSPHQRRDHGRTRRRGRARPAPAPAVPSGRSRCPPLVNACRSRPYAGQTTHSLAHTTTNATHDTDDPARSRDPPPGESGRAVVDTVNARPPSWDLEPPRSEAAPRKTPRRGEAGEARTGRVPLAWPLRDRSRLAHSGRVTARRSPRWRACARDRGTRSRCCAGCYRVHSRRRQAESANARWRSLVRLARCRGRS